MHNIQNERNILSKYIKRSSARVKYNIAEPDQLN